MKLMLSTTSWWTLLGMIALVVTGIVVVSQFGQAESAKRDLGIVGQLAPELKVSKWIGLPSGKLRLEANDFKGKVTYLYFFQSWCPGCHSIGFPALQKLEKQFRGKDEVQFVAVQTTFEGHDVNTADKLVEIAKRYELNIPFGQSAEDSGTPEIMRKYRTGGTPWVVLIDKQGQVVFNDFQIDVDGAAKAIDALRQTEVNIDAGISTGENTMTERAVLAGGCFWGMQDLFRKQPGVLETRVGYTGGNVANASYRNHGTHAEGIEVIFDPNKTSYRKLLEFFFQVHDPTTLNRQGNDQGMAYRSAIYFTSEEQKSVAIDTIKDVNASGIWPGKVVTEVEPATEFWEAEPEHQDYLLRKPNGYTCHYPRPDWVLTRRSEKSK